MIVDPSLIDDNVKTTVIKLKDSLLIKEMNVCYITSKVLCDITANAAYANV